MIVLFRVAVEEKSLSLVSTASWYCTLPLRCYLGGCVNERVPSSPPSPPLCRCGNPVQASLEEVLRHRAFRLGPSTRLGGEIVNTIG